MSNATFSALSFGIDHYIPTKSKYVAIVIELEQLYPGLLRNLALILDKEITTLKTKLRSTCEKYRKIDVPNKYKKVINSLSKNKDSVILKQDRGRGVVILDKAKYTEKFIILLNTERFKKITTDPTAATERKIQKVLRKVKSKFSEQEYKGLNQKGSAPAPLNGTVKIHKLKNDRAVDELPI